MFFTIFAIFHLLAAEAIDTEMESVDKKSTGIYKLTDKEKAALQRWIDARYQRKTEEQRESQKPITGNHPTLSENLMGSQYLRLSDKTLWNVRAEDVPIAQGWITPTEIIVSQSASPFFPYKLTNKITGSSVSARKVDKLPEPQTPALAPNTNNQPIPMGPSSKK